MNKTIKLNTDKKSSFLSALVRGTPYEFNVLGKNIVIIGSFYKFKKQREFFDEYWTTFRNGLSDINPNQEFESNYAVHRFNCLSGLEQMAVAWKLSETYAYDNKITYAKFCDTVDSYFSQKKSNPEPDFFGNGAA